MPISFKVDVHMAAEAGDTALDPDQVYFQYICQTGPGQHDPSASPDDHVRPAHAALHGTIWRLDDPAAPIPPIGYGCRCGMRLCAAPATGAAQVLPVAVGEPEDDSMAPAERYLDNHAPEWKEVALAAAKAAPGKAIDAAYDTAKELGYSRDVARMVLEVKPPPAQIILGTGPLSGVGNAGRKLVERWRQGDMAAAEKLKKSYPATYVRILAEENLQQPGVLKSIPMGGDRHRLESA